MTPVRFITRGAMVTIHSDYVSVSVTRFVRDTCCGFDRIYMGCPSTAEHPARCRATYAKRRNLSDINDIDAFVNEVIEEFKDRARY